VRRSASARTPAKLARTGDACTFVPGVTGWLPGGLDGHRSGRAPGALQATITIQAGVGGVTCDLVARTTASRARFRRIGQVHHP
jgi:hypothetical protein